jgi:Protein of unknown function (DUF1533)
MRKIITIILLAIAFKASAKTVVIGSGSGTVSQTSMTGLSVGDILMIKKGTYSGATFSNIHDVTIINDTTGTVTFTGQFVIGSSIYNLTIFGNGYSGAFYGFQFGTPGSTFSNIAISLQGGNTRGLRIYNCEFWNVQNTIVDGSGYGVTYTGDTSTLKLYRASFDHWKMHSCDVLYQGSFGTANQFLVPTDSFAITNMIIDTLYSNGTVINNNGGYRMLIHDWTVDATCLNPSGDVGMIVDFGNGNFYNLYKHGGRGYTARIWGCGLNGPGVVNIYNCIDLASNAYGFADVRVDTTQLTASKTIPAIWGADFHVFNNTSGNKIDVNGYVCPVVIAGTWLSYKMEIRNNIGFNNQYGANPIINNNSSGQTMTDTSNNYYFSAAQSLLVFTDTASCLLKSGSPMISAGYNPPLSSAGANGVAWGNPPGVGANAYASGALTPPALIAAVGATVDNPFTVTFTPTPAWNSAITSITVNGTTISSSAYSVTSGAITFTPASSTLLQTNGIKSIAVNATGYTPASVTQSLGVGAASKLIVIQQPVGPVSNGGLLVSQPQVEIADQYNNQTSSTATVVATASGWTIGGTTSVAGVSGVSTFTNITAGTALTTNYTATIVFTSSGLTSATSNSFTIVGTSSGKCNCVVKTKKYKILFVSR